MIIHFLCYLDGLVGRASNLILEGIHFLCYLGWLSWEGVKLNIGRSCVRSAFTAPYSLVDY